MAHSCELCEEVCYCDGEDTEMTQPENCVHFTRLGGCNADAEDEYQYYEDEYDAA